MLQQDSTDLEEDMRVMRAEVSRVQEERRLQQQKFHNKLASKDATASHLTAVNDALKRQVDQAKASLNLEAIEAKIQGLLIANQSAFEAKVALAKDVESASQYVSELEAKIF
jgi:seryl-tRNA synthetase